MNSSKFSDIRSSGDNFILFVGVLTSAFTPVLIALTFAVLEWFRVFYGSQALGQNEFQSGLIAFAVVTANFVIPIYALRQIAELGYLPVRQTTVRGSLGRLLNRVVGVEQVVNKDLYHNPMLKFASFVVTITTIVLAIYDLVHPILLQLVTSEYTEPLLILIVKLSIGIGLSFAGVYFLKSASHEIGVKMHQLAYDKTEQEDQQNKEEFLQLNEAPSIFDSPPKRPTNPALYEGFTDAQIERWETDRVKDLSGNER